MGNLIAAAMAFVIVGCADARKDDKRLEDYGDFYRANGTLNTSPTSHPQGWGKSECFACHNINNIHKVVRISGLDVDLDAIEKKIDTDGLTSCSTCHGSNGTD